MVQFIDQSIRDEHSKSMPSREERKENLNNMSAQCSYAPCGKIMHRSDAKLCSRCKQVSGKVALIVSWALSHPVRGALLCNYVPEGALVCYIRGS